MQIMELATDAQIASAFPLMATLRDRIAADTFLGEVRTQELDGYRLVGLYVEDELVSLAGVRPAHTLSRGPHVFVDDLVTAAAHQGRGYATALLRWVAAQALQNGLPRTYLDARSSALGFYDQLKFKFLTSVPCWIECQGLAAV